MALEPERIRTIAELDQLLAASTRQPVVVLKHSTRCPTSTRAQREFLDFARVVPRDGARLAVVFVVEDRTVSNEMARRLGVRHQSPQALVIVDGKARWHDSHEGVTASALTEALSAT